MIRTVPQVAARVGREWGSLREGAIPLRFQGGVGAPINRGPPFLSGADGVVGKRSRSLFINIRVAHLIFLGIY